MRRHLLSTSPTKVKQVGAEGLAQHRDVVRNDDGCEVARPRDTAYFYELSSLKLRRIVRALDEDSGGGILDEERKPPVRDRGNYAT